MKIVICISLISSPDKKKTKQKKNKNKKQKTKLPVKT